VGSRLSPSAPTTSAAAFAQSGAAEVVGAEGLRRLPTPNMGAEDFAFYLERLDGCFMRIGTLGDGMSAAGVHTPRFDPDERALFVGGAVLAAIARVASAG